MILGRVFITETAVLEKYYNVKGKVSLWIVWRLELLACNKVGMLDFLVLY